MWSNTKLLVTVSIFTAIVGFILLWFGFNQNTENIPLPIEDSNPIKSGSTSVASLGIDGEKILVTKVVDGDTIEVAGGKTIRLIGIDTPETVDPRRPVGCFGKEASNEHKKLVTGKQVILQKDVSETDKYGRLLRYVYLPLPDGNLLFINDYLVREGFAKVLTYPPDIKFNEQFLQAEREARVNKRGLWRACSIP